MGDLDFAADAAFELGREAGRGDEGAEEGAPEEEQTVRK